MRNRVLYACLTALTLAACASEVGEPVTAEAEPLEGRSARTTLRVSLYPWIPDAAEFAAFIEGDFERSHPQIDLIVRDLALSDTVDLAYDIDAATRALTEPDRDDAQDLIEVDTVTLGALRARQAIVPFGLRAPEYLPFARQAVTLDERAFGVPHWTCGYFAISEDAAIRTARDVDELVRTLSAERDERVDLAGLLDGDWDAISVYLDALHDGEPRRSLEDALQDSTLDAGAAAALERVGRACTRDGESFCASDASELFASGAANALVGYSERLNAVLSAPAPAVLGPLHVASATLGRGDHPVLFTDALVLSPRCDARCRVAARAFAEYYVSDATFEVALLARDVADDAVPRYLLPSTESAFEIDAVADDRLYRELHEEIRAGVPLPNTGIPEAKERNQIRAAVQARLGISAHSH